MKHNDDLLEIAQIGKTVGLKGELKLHLHCDFPEQFKKDSIFFTNKQNRLVVENYIQNRSIIKFVGYDNKEEASTLINQLLLSNIDNTKENCKLKEDEHFWFEIIGTKIEENNKILGEVVAIERFEPNDFLIVKTYKTMLEDGYANKFMIPYIDRYIINFDKKSNKIFTKDVLGILENS